MRRLAWLMVGLALVIVAGAARADRFVPGDEAKASSSKLTSEIHWYTSLDAAKAAAQKQHKMIFWMHMLGTLDGCT